MNATPLLYKTCSAAMEEGIPTGRYFHPEELRLLDTKRIPSHIAFIPDGNRRWAKRAERASFQHGHQNGADTMIEIVKASKQLGIKAVTFYAFSTENWTRPKDEIDALMWLFQTYLTDKCPLMIEEGIRLFAIGDLSKIPETVFETIQETSRQTSACDQIDLILAINYGGRDELVRTFQRMMMDIEKGKLDITQVTENSISRYLDTSPWGDPELLVRTSGEMRISNFLIWQLAYTELYVSEQYWPDFTPKHLLQALLTYQKRQRRLGT
jgi:undecaprenyl diphosphate synthase